jgi:hypothetical protein
MIMQILFYSLVAGLILSLFIAFMYRPKNIKVYPLDEKPMFARFLGCGFELNHMHFRLKDKGEIYVRYSFFYLFWLPIFPGTCYGIKHISTKLEYKTMITNYSITHIETKSWIEIFAVYLFTISVIGVIIGVFVVF